MSFYLILVTINTIFFYKLLNTKLVYKILLSILFWNFISVFAVIFKVMISNLYYDIFDNIGYNKISYFVHDVTMVSSYLFLILHAVVLYIIYRKCHK